MPTFFFFRFFFLTPCVFSFYSHFAISNVCMFFLCSTIHKACLKQPNRILWICAVGTSQTQILLFFAFRSFTICSCIFWNFSFVKYLIGLFNLVKPAWGCSYFSLSLSRLIFNFCKLLSGYRLDLSLLFSYLI